jgi:hypothetical protein
MVGTAKESELAVWNMETIIKHCGNANGDAVSGAMVGWAPFPVEDFRRLVMVLCTSRDSTSGHESGC